MNPIIVPFSSYPPKMAFYPSMTKPQFHLSRHMAGVIIIKRAATHWTNKSFAERTARGAWSNHAGALTRVYLNCPPHRFARLSTFPYVPSELTEWHFNFPFSCGSMICRHRKINSRPSRCLFAFRHPRPIRISESFLWYWDALVVTKFNTPYDCYYHFIFIFLGVNPLLVQSLLLIVVSVLWLLLLLLTMNFPWQ